MLLSAQVELASSAGEPDRQPQAALATGPVIVTNSNRRLFNDVIGGGPAKSKEVVVRNRGDAPLVVPADAFSITGVNHNMFRILSQPGGAFTVQPGGSQAISIAFSAPADVDPGIYNAKLTILSNDPATPAKGIILRGLATSGVGGAHEPSLARVFELFQYPARTGDTNSDDVILNDAALASTSEVTMPRLRKAGPGPVRLEPMTLFAVEASPAVKLGWYYPGTPGAKTELVQVSKLEAQSVTPTFNGSASFDPGDTNFSFYTQWPTFKNTDGSLREVYSEDALNTWDSNDKHKFRFYPYMDRHGNVVPNAYVAAVEEFTRDYDFQDVVFVIFNVKPDTARPEVGIENLQANTPYSDRLVFSRITNLDPEVPNEFSETASFRIRNTGENTLTVSSLALNNAAGKFQFENAPGTPFNISPGGSRDVKVKFIATSGKIVNSSITIATNDSDEPTKTIELSGFYQSHSENNASGVSQEAKLDEIFQLFGYTTRAVYSGQSMNGGGKLEAKGDEVLSPYWQLADPDQPARVVQITGFHKPENNAGISYHNKGSDSTTKIFTILGPWAQSVFPRINASDALAVGYFKPSQDNFGFKVDSEWSDNTKNDQEQTGGNYGHHMRFYPARDKEGKDIPNTWLMSMDYQSVNFDYNDNTYLITNIKPETRLTPPIGPSATVVGTGMHIDWGDQTSSVFRGYNLYRSTSPTLNFTKLNSSLLTTSFFNDKTTVADTKYYYRIAAVNSSGLESQYASVTGKRA